MAVVGYTGEIRAVAFNFAPQGWALCDGSVLPISGNEMLFQLLGTTYGGDGSSTFGLPDLQGRIPIGVGQASHLLGEQGGAESVTLTTAQLPQHAHGLLATTDPASTKSPSEALLATTDAIELYSADPPVKPLNPASVSPIGGNQPHDNLQPYLVVNYIISLGGIYPNGPATQDDPFVGEIRAMAIGFAPSGFAPCRGQLVPLQQYIQMFTLLGTTFGGNGNTTFALPDLQDSVAMGAGQGTGLSDRSIGDTGGEELVTLLEPQMPSHGHTLMAATGNGTTPKPGSSLAIAGAQAYRDDTTGLTQLNPEALTPAGGGAPHNNLQPYVALGYVIAMQGVFPPRS
jgi:microcystin-dependent protein